MGSGGRAHRMPSRARSLVIVIMAISAALLTLIVLTVFDLIPSWSSFGDGYGGAAISLSNAALARSERNIKAEPWVEAISWNPRAFVYHNMLTQAECAHLIELARPHMVKSTVVDSTTGRSKDSRVRTSSGTFLNRGQDVVVKNIEQRIADFTFVPVEHGEGLQVLHYEVGQKYEPHYDYFHDTFNTRNGGQRIATVLMYLTDVESGGETVFPGAAVNSSDVPGWEELSTCAKAGLSVRPRMGDALLFWSMGPDATLDPSSLHGGCPVIEGNKWSATKWLHMNKYAVPVT